jgi:hypothetical protein
MVHIPQAQTAFSPDEERDLPIYQQRSLSFRINARTTRYWR